MESAYTKHHYNRVCQIGQMIKVQLTPQKFRPKFLYYHNVVISTSFKMTDETKNVFTEKKPFSGTLFLLVLAKMIIVQRLQPKSIREYSFKNLKKSPNVVSFQQECGNFSFWRAQKFS